MQGAKQKVLALRAQMPRLGTRKLHYLLKDSLQKDGVKMGRDALFDLLRGEDLLVKKRRRFTKTTNSSHWMRKYPNRAKALVIKRPEALWVADITYVTLREGYCYLHLITDAYSKLIQGWSVSADMAATSTAAALKMAIKERSYHGALTHHSDRGLQYCSSLYTNLLEQNGIIISMTEDGSPYDNAIAERVNGILKDEFGIDEVFNSIKDVQKQVSQSIHIYNNQRPHLSNGMLTPMEMHRQNKLKPKQWNKKATTTTSSYCGSLS